MNVLNMLQVDTYRLRAKPYGTIAYTDLFGHLVDTKRAAVGEELFGGIGPPQYVFRRVAFNSIQTVFHVPGYVEADEVTLPQAAHDLPPRGDDVEYSRRWKSGIVEKADLKVR